MLEDDTHSPNMEPYEEEAPPRPPPPPFQPTIRSSRRAAASELRNIASLDVCPHCHRGEASSSSGMVCCDDCAQWWHFRCVGFGLSPIVPDHWACPNCSHTIATTPLLKRSLEETVTPTSMGDRPTSIFGGGVHLVSIETHCSVNGCLDDDAMSPSVLREHITEHLSVLLRRSSSSGPVIFSCPWSECDATCVNRGNLQRHLERVHCGMRWVCASCNKDHDRRTKAGSCCASVNATPLSTPVSAPATTTTSKKPRRSGHHHTDSDDESSSSKPPCLVASIKTCGMSGCADKTEFRNGLELRAHLRLHYETSAGDLGYLCKWLGCGALCSNKGSMQHHVERQHCGMMWACASCGRRSKEKIEATECSCVDHDDHDDE